MAWAKLDDGFADHPKVIEAGPLASWLFVCGLTYCARQLTDGFIPAGQMRKLADVDNAKELAQTLVSVGLWEECDGGYMIHDYLEYNPSRERVLATREVRAEVGSRGGKQKAANAATVLKEEAAAETKQNASKLVDVSQTFATENLKQSLPRPVPVPYPNPIPKRPRKGKTNEIARLRRLCHCQSTPRCLKSFGERIQADTGIKSRRTPRGDHTAWTRPARSMSAMR